MHERKPLTADQIAQARTKRLSLVERTFTGPLNDVTTARDLGVGGLDIVISSLAARQSEAFAKARLDLDGEMVADQKLKIANEIIEYLRKRALGPSNQHGVQLVDLPTDRRDGHLTRIFEEDPNSLLEVRAVVFALLGTGVNTEPIEAKPVHTDSPAVELKYPTRYEGVFIYETKDARWQTPEDMEGMGDQGSYTELDSIVYYGLGVRD